MYYFAYGSNVKHGDEYQKAVNMSFVAFFVTY